MFPYLFALVAMTLRRFVPFGDDVPTVDIVNETGRYRINAADYRPGVHTLAEDQLLPPGFNAGDGVASLPGAAATGGQIPAGAAPLNTPTQVASAPPAFTPTPGAERDPDTEAAIKTAQTPDTTTEDTDKIAEHNTGTNEDGSLIVSGPAAGETEPATPVAAPGMNQPSGTVPDTLSQQKFITQDGSKFYVTNADGSVKLSPKGFKTAAEANAHAATLA